MAKISRGLRNNNPLNIRINGDNFQGEIKGSDKSFKQFKTMAYGYRAAMKILLNYRNKYYLDTVEKIIKRWAPENENNTEAYINTVCARAGVKRGEKLTLGEDEMCRIVSAMSFVENGVTAEDNDVRAGYTLL